ncbi:otu domain-containing protein 5-a [Phtheirospermum japonicum]|uniref:Otu domain-containing protein 5-a n=1 Tax=Phtheirospermum japonicum TaxID=374723 RepID=A0A830CCB7_9LAMI|nr:otu domain-containing protein 5-a [Phtheirospermum japonicum]
MTMHQLDPDVVRWGLNHLIDVCSLTNNGSPQTVTCYEEDLSWTASVDEGFSCPRHSIVENDEIIAQALQEELSKLAVAEASGSTSSEEQRQKASFLAQDWLGHSGWHLNFGEAGDEAGLSKLEKLSIESEDQDSLPEMECESALDGELYDLVELKISGDGNCQFRSLSDQIYRTAEHHKFVREQVVNQLKSQTELYENYVPMGYTEYVKKMSKYN